MQIGMAAAGEVGGGIALRAAVRALKRAQNKTDVGAGPATAEREDA